ncbi:MAE_28990/MAE_18760 family HEPN-like nuclease [Paenibacillus sp. FSL M7-0420]|uniref:MAE_28990/MAE_18760 family HEPN-like nuclease n=1 Tax=Paenibacillus sp. FSL M7-0420 TaxID=2921609 RepID=UPI0030FAEB92
MSSSHNPFNTDITEFSTFASLFIEELEERWTEIEILIEQIKIQSNDEVKNVLCRSAVVLLVAHLEGFMKEAASTFIKDLNHHCEFIELPKRIQKTYCTLFLSTVNDSGGIDNRIQGRLLEKFGELNARLTVEPFLYDRNKNPSPTVIETILNNFGVKDFFKLLHMSSLDIVFENNSSETLIFLEELREYTIQAVEKFPYNINLENYAISIKDGRLARENSLWILFIDELLRKRHSIAHGSNFRNEISINELEDAKIKVQILQYSIALVLFSSGITIPSPMLNDSLL